jgi:hypothetical protein
MAIVKVKLDRKQLNSFLKNQEQVKQFETLFRLVNEMQATIEDHESRIGALEP